MNASETARAERAAPLLVDEGRASSLAGTIIVILALLSALVTFLIVAGLTPITPTHDVVVSVLVINGVLVLCLVVVIFVEGWAVWRARRARAAAAGLHLRFIGWFAGLAALPAIFIAIVTSITLERSLDPWFRADLSTLLGNTVEIARSYEEGQCRTIARETNLMASDLNRAKPTFDQNRTLFRDWLATRSLFLGFPVAMILSSDGSAIETVQHVAVKGIVLPRAQDYAEASDTEPFCFLPRNGGDAFGALLKLSAFDDAFLFVARPGDPRASAYTAAAEEGLRYYEGLEAKRVGVQIAFASMYLLVTLILLLSAIRLGLSFANWLVLPIRRLIHATDQVAAGNFYVQVPTRKGESDLAHLSATFNGMTQELRTQHDRLLAANEMMDKRRRFTEAVLAGVSAGVIGIDGKGRITVLNPSADKLVTASKTEGSVGATIDDIIPAVSPLVQEAREGRHRLVQGQIALARGPSERQVSVRVTKETGAEATEGYVITLDDITDLVSAQRSAAWADVARRIAHEIKNPLTPIQLSAERLKRKYGKFITSDREVFDQCTNTIIRQVDDIRRMVDEFSSFARTPKPVLEESDVVDVVKQVVFLMQVARPDLDFITDLPEAPVIALFDRRLIGQATTNIIKNATEAIEQKANGQRGAVTVKVASANGFVTVEVTDTGQGFPENDRQKLLEPYVTTRKEGTGLGLAIVGKILEEHGGGIELLDHPDAASGQSGARVRLWFQANVRGEMRLPQVSSFDGNRPAGQPTASGGIDQPVREGLS